MDNDLTCVFPQNTKITELKRSSADYWIIYVSHGDAEFTAGTNMCCATSGQAVIVTLSNRDVQIKYSRDFKGGIIRVSDLTLAELVRQYLPLINTYDDTLNVITAGKQQKNIAAVFQNMQNTDISDVARQRSLLEELMIRLYRASPKGVAGAYANRTEIISNIRDRLEKQYNEDFSLTCIAADYNMSVSYLAHLFKDITGVSIMRYLLNCRIFAAKEYLSQTITPVKEIAEICGFNDASNFGRTFKKEVGLTPRQYRRQHSVVTTETDALSTDK